MVTNLGDTPPEVRQAFVEGLEILLDPEDTGGDTLRKAPPPGVQIFTLTLDDLVKPNWQERVKRAGWLFLGTDANGRAVAGDVVRVSDKNTHELTSLSRDPVLNDAAEIFRRERQRDRGSKESFTMTLLRIPGILTEALWLRANDPNGTDRFVPILTSTPNLKAGEEYPVTVFLPEVQRLVEQFRGFDRLPKNPASLP
jgi:hypothetical protein